MVLPPSHNIDKEFLYLSKYIVKVVANVCLLLLQKLTVSNMKISLLGKNTVQWS